VKSFVLSAKPTKTPMAIARYCMPRTGNRIYTVEAFLGMPRYMLAWLSDLRGGAVPFAFLECSHGRC
jgi:hypothetical protein